MGLPMRKPRWAQSMVHWLALRAPQGARVFSICSISPRAWCRHHRGRQLPVTPGLPGYKTRYHDQQERIDTASQVLGELASSAGRAP